MKKGIHTQKPGFTIVEVALVLAIAGLIFLMVFIALPALQRSQRDAQRREDIATLLSNVKKYQTNNRGALPKCDTSSGKSCTINWDKNWDSKTTDWPNLYYAYLGENFVDPDGTNYTLYVTACVSSASATCKDADKIENATFPNDHKITIYTAATCDGALAVGSNNPRKIAAVYKLEGAGAYCSNT